MRKVVFGGAMSLDGYIAGPNGEYDWIPVLLGGGIPLLPSPAGRARLQLKKHRVYEKTGTVLLEYDLVPASEVTP